MPKSSFTKRLIGNLYHRGIQMLFMGIVTGFLSGVVVTFYNILASIGEAVSTGYYAYLREHWQLIPLLFIALVAAAFVVGVAVKFVHLLRGSGIPQTEGIARGELRYKNWFATLCGMFATSLACIFLGLSAGSEGPSIQIGGCCGYGSAPLLTRTDMLRRYQITGGACAGLAVAFNAPLTGMAFAFEETLKRFSPEVFICAFSSVISAVSTRNLIRGWLGYSTGAVFTEYAFYPDLPLENYGFVILTSLVCALLGIVFYYAVLWLKQLVDTKITFAHNTGKMLLPFVLGGVFGLLTQYAMGGGHSLIEAFGTSGGTEEMTVERIFSLSLVATIGIILLLKLVASIVNMACGVPCGVFIPMLAIGAALGALMSILFTNGMGMDGKYSDLIVMIGMASFFTCVVRAPITGMVMVLELTWNFTALLPVAIGVSIGYMVGEVVHTEPIYEVVLKQMVKEQRSKEEKRKLRLDLTVVLDSKAADMAIKDVLWPVGASVVSIVRNGEPIPVEADLVLLGGDKIVVECETAEPQFAERELRLLCGDYPEEVKQDRYWNRIKE